MKDFFKKAAYKLSVFMYGRYGGDELSLFLLFVFLAFSVLSIIPYCWVLYPLGLAASVYSLFRCFSKNIYKRQVERRWFLNLTGKIKSFFRRRKRIFKERKTHKFFKCKKCRAVLRVPKGKGKIEITCPKCKTKTTKKT